MSVSKLLSLSFLGNELQLWLVAAGCFAFVAIGLRLVQAFVTRHFRRIADKTSTYLDDVVVDVLNATGPFLYFAAALHATHLVLVFPGRAEDVVRSAAYVSLVFQMGIWALAGVASFLAEWSKRRSSSGSATMAAALHFVARLVIWSLLILSALSLMGVRVTGLLAGLGVGGIAAALAVQNVLGDLFASLSIYFDRPFDLEDFIIVDDFMGSVSRVGIRSTRVTSLGGEQIIFPNSDLAKSRIRNYGRMQERRIVFHIGIEYGTPVEKVEAIPARVAALIGAVRDCRFDRCHLQSFGDSALVYEIVYYLLDADYGAYMDRQQEINFAILRYFEETDIAFAFPTQTLHVVPTAERPG